MKEDGARQIFVAHPWANSPEAGTFRDALNRVGQELNVDFVFPEEEEVLGSNRLEENLSRAALSIFDLSQWNPNVAYEFGVANGLEVPSIALLRKDSNASTAPASIQGSAEVRYSGFDELAALLEPLIRRHVGSGLTAPALSGLQKSAEPPEVTSEVLDLLRTGDDFGLVTLARRERDEFQSKLRSRLQLYARENDLSGFDAALMPLLERYLAWLLPLVDHRSPILRDELLVMGRFHGSRPMMSAPRRWATMTNWVTWWLANSIGAFALFTENFEAIEDLFWTPVEDERSARRVLATVLPETGGIELSEMRLNEGTGRRFRDPAFHYLTQTLNTAPLFSRWNAGFVQEAGGALRWLADFNFLSCLYAGKEHELITASWAGIDSGGEAIANRIRADARFQERLAQIFRVPSAELVSSVPRWLEPILNQGVPGRLVISEALAPWEGP